MTDEHKALIGEMVQEYHHFIRNPNPFDMDTVKAWLVSAYSLYGATCPERIEVVPSTQVALDLATELTGAKQVSIDWCGIPDSGWVACYDFLERIGTDLGPNVEHVRNLREFIRCAWGMILLDEAAIVIKMPKLSMDDEGRAHAAGGPAVLWENGEMAYAWHGTWISKRMAEDAKSYTKEDYAAITDTEVRRAFGEIVGWDHVVNLLGAVTVNVWTDPSTSLTYELLKSAIAGVDLKWLRKQSPKLQTGEQPLYIEPVHEDLRTAQAARKWQAVLNTPAECEADPVLSYWYEA